MKAGLRLRIAAFAAALALGPAPALGQAAPAPTENTTAPETVGPSELQDFTLNGTVTQPADTPPPRPGTPAERPPATPERPSARPVSPAATPGSARIRQANESPAPAPAPQRPIALPGPTPSAPARSVTVALPPVGSAVGYAPGYASVTDSAPTTLGAERSSSILPWFLLAALLGAAAAWVFWRQRFRQPAIAGPEIDMFAAPEPPVRPAPLPHAPPRAPPPPPPSAAPKPAAGPGIVSARLRPWLDLTFRPLGCIVEADRIILPFELELLNSGGAPARDIVVEIMMFNAGPTQEQDMAAFFAKSPGPGEPIPGIAPLQHVTIQNSVVAARSDIKLVELGGRQVFVPVISFNAYYRTSSGEGQSSASFLIGRATAGDKLGPLRIERLRQINGLGARTLPVGVRK